MARTDAEEGARARPGAPRSVRNDVAHSAADCLYRGRPRGAELVRTRTSRLSRRISLYAWRTADGVPRPAMDHAPIRRLCVGGGVERALSLPARARPDRAVGGIRSADPDGLRPGPPHGRGGGGQ